MARRLAAATFASTQSAAWGASISRGSGPTTLRCSGARQRSRDWEPSTRSSSSPRESESKWRAGRRRSSTRLSRAGRGARSLWATTTSGGPRAESRSVRASRCLWIGARTPAL
eukprot:Amastigsp_a513985_7.p7 type:complete len:113 gc:universal Amastigsp_a513985_7:635-973(+)